MTPHADLVPILVNVIGGHTEVLLVRPGSEGKIARAP